MQDNCKQISADRHQHESSARVRRRTVPSSNNIKKLELESTRVRLIRLIENNGLNGSYRNVANSIEPKRIVTRQAERNQIRNQKFTVIPAFHTFANDVQYGETQDTSTATSFLSDFVQDTNINCKCFNCTRAQCPANRFTTVVSGCRGNIMTFCDQATMTPTLVNAMCGVTPSVCPSMIAVRDTDDQSEFTASTPECYGCVPPPTTPKSCCTPIHYDYGKCRMRFRDVALRRYDMVNDYCKPNQYCPSQWYFKTPKSLCKENRQTCPKIKNIYNEGISDIIVRQLPVCPPDAIRVFAPQEQKHDCCGPAISAKCCISETYPHTPTDIPHSHKYGSKYHAECNKRFNEDKCHCESPPGCIVGPFPKAVNKSPPRSPVPMNTSCRRQPKKNLISFKNIAECRPSKQSRVKCKCKKLSF